MTDDELLGLLVHIPRLRAERELRELRMGQAKLPEDASAAVEAIKRVVQDATEDEGLAQEAAEAFAWRAVGGQGRGAAAPMEEEVPPAEFCEWRMGEEGAAELIEEFEKEG